MGVIYNRIAGSNLERLAALSDGIFGVAMTLLVLNLVVPAKDMKPRINNDLDLLHALWGQLAPHMLVYVMSFLTLGIFWVGQQTQLSNFVQSNRDLTWIHLGFLLGVTLMPFSTSLLAAYLGLRVALLVYWFNILLLGIWLYISWRFAAHMGLLKDTVSAEMKAAAERRIIVAQALYAFGALLCIFSTYVSVAFIVLVQLNYVFAPRIRLLYRL